MPDDKPWLARVVESVDPKIIGAIVAALLMGGLAHNNAQIAEHDKSDSVIERRVDSLRVAVSRHEAEIKRLRHGKALPPEPAPARSPVRSFFSLLFSPFHVPQKDRP